MVDVAGSPTVAVTISVTVRELLTEVAMPSTDDRKRNELLAAEWVIVTRVVATVRRIVCVAVTVTLPTDPVAQGTLIVVSWVGVLPPVTLSAEDGGVYISLPLRTGGE